MGKALRRKYPGCLSAREVTMITGVAYTKVLKAIKDGDLLYIQKITDDYPMNTFVISLDDLREWLLKMQHGIIPEVKHDSRDEINSRVLDFRRTGYINTDNFRM